MPPMNQSSPPKMVKLLCKKTGQVIELDELEYLFSKELLELHGWCKLPPTSAAGVVGPSLNPRAPAFVPGRALDSCVNQRRVANPQPRPLPVPTLYQVHLNSQMPISMNLQGTSSIRQPSYNHSRYAIEMSDPSSHGHLAMEILREQLANADMREANDVGGRRLSLPCPLMSDVDADSQAVEARSPRQSDLALSQHVHYGTSSSEFDVSNDVSETSSIPQQHNNFQGTMLPRLNGDLALVTTASAGDGVGRDVFSNDHLSGTIVPLEDPAEALALSQSQVPIEIRQQRTRQLNLLTCGPNQHPTVEVALHADNFPFVEGASLAEATSAYGVIRLRDIPESTRRSEILALMGRNSKVLNDKLEPVHIIIKRINAATREAYVEFTDAKAAEDVIEKFERAKKDGRAPRLGDYPLVYEMSSQAALMEALFPLAKGVQWISAVPHIIPAEQVLYSWEAFKGFITAEEMHVLAKHAESNTNWRSPQRPYECMISVLRKMPWYMTEHITIFQRQSVYEATIRLIKSLQRQMRFRNNSTLLNNQLLERLWVSAMMCHGFTVTMKDNIAFCVKVPVERMCDFNMPRFPELWVHTHTLVPKPGASLDVLEWYIAMIRETTTQEVERLPPNELSDLRRQVGGTTLYWGYYWKVLGLVDIVGPAVDNMSLGEMARREFLVISGILHQAFGGQQGGPGQQQLIALGHQQVNGGQQSGLGGQSGQ